MPQTKEHISGLVPQIPLPHLQTNQHAHFPPSIHLHLLLTSSSRNQPHVPFTFPLALLFFYHPLSYHHTHHHTHHHNPYRPLTPRMKSNKISYSTLPNPVSPSLPIQSHFFNYRLRPPIGSQFTGAIKRYGVCEINCGSNLGFVVESSSARGLGNVGCGIVFSLRSGETITKTRRGRERERERERRWCRV